MRRAIRIIVARLAVSGMVGVVALAALAFAIASAGCAARKQAPRGYHEVLAAWTRSASVYSGVESRLYMGATYKGREFREAYVDRYAALYLLDADYAALLKRREAEQTAEYSEFFLSVYTPDDRWNDLDRPDSIWKLYLEDSTGARLSPVSVKRVEGSEAFVREFFPYMDFWSRGYLVRFPLYGAGASQVPSPDASHFKLVVTGALGRGELVWRTGEGQSATSGGR